MSATTSGPAGRPSSSRPSRSRATQEARFVRLLARGSVKHCPNCGSGHLYDGWFQMKERCPRCGMRFERERGFFVGAYLINFCVIIVVLFVLCMGVVALKAVDDTASAWPLLVAGLFTALVLPIAFYPFARTIWSALDLALTPLSAAELTEASLHATDTDPASGAAVAATTRDEAS